MQLKVFLVISLCCGLPATLFCSDAAVITLKAEALVAGNVVTLADLAEIEGSGASTLSRISIMRSPQGRSGITLSARTIAEKVRAGYRAPVLFKGADQVHIAVRSIEISREVLEKTFIDEVMKQSPWKGTGKIVVEKVRVPRCPLVREAGAPTIQAKFSPHEDFLGTVVASLIIGSGSSPERAMVSGKVKLLADVPVVRSMIKAGCTLSSTDLEVRTMDISRTPKAYTRLEDCVGLRAKFTLREGSPVVPSQVQQKPDVCSGEMVFIEARVNNLVVRDRGIALKDGYQGDPIPVKNTASGRQVVGTIIAAALVQVQL
ncbi:MAG: flagellar basal body P-ring formation chaperone FlgA [Deltaproteobacteria bacterium]|nr:flagellar basal body P-ring formation chaperone FlgA [Deltaproteobacteria bacterium]